MTCEEFTKELNKHTKLHYDSEKEKFYFFDEEDFTPNFKPNGEKIFVPDIFFPKNGLYVLFDEYEPLDNTSPTTPYKRIVRIGKNEEDNDLLQELQNIFRGSNTHCLFRNHIDLSLMNSPLFNENTSISKQVSKYIEKHISVVVIRDDSDLRNKYEYPLISLLNNCETYQPTKTWLGKYSQYPRISNGKLWNIYGLDTEYNFTKEDKETLFSNVKEPIFCYGINKQNTITPQMKDLPITSENIENLPIETFLSICNRYLDLINQSNTIDEVVEILCKEFNFDKDTIQKILNESEKMGINDEIEQLSKILERYIELSKYKPLSQQQRENLDFTLDTPAIYEISKELNIDRKYVKLIIVYSIKNDII